MRGTRPLPPPPPAPRRAGRGSACRGALAPRGLRRSSRSRWPRGDRIHPDPVRREVERRRSGERFDAALRRVVGAHLPVRAVGRERADVDDRARSTGIDEASGDEAGAEEHAREVRADDFVPAFGCLVEQVGHRAREGGVVDQDVDATEGGAGRSDEPFRLGRAADVGGDGDDLAPLAQLGMRVGERRGDRGR